MITTVRNICIYTGQNVSPCGPNGSEYGYYVIHIHENKDEEPSMKPFHSTKGKRNSISLKYKVMSSH